MIRNPPPSASRRVTEGGATEIVSLYLMFDSARVRKNPRYILILYKAVEVLNNSLFLSTCLMMRGV